MHIACMLRTYTTYVTCKSTVEGILVNNKGPYGEMIDVTFKVQTLTTLIST